MNEKNDRQESVPEPHLVKKVGEGLRNIEITLQHSVYLNALTSGLLINPESFGDCLLEKNISTSGNQTIASENKCDDSKKSDDQGMKKVYGNQGIGHGRSCPSFSLQSGPSGGRGKIKSLLKNLSSEKKTTLDNQTPTQVASSGLSECAALETPDSSCAKIDYLEFKNDQKVSEGLTLSDVKDSRDKFTSYENEIKKKSKLEEDLCFQLLKGKNKKSTSDSRNRKSKLLSESHKLKAHPLNALAVSSSNQENYDELISSQNKCYKSPVNPFLLASSISSTEQDPIKFSQFHSSALDAMIKVDTERIVNNDGDLKYKTSEFSPEDSSFNEGSQSIVNSPCVNEEKNIRISGNTTKSMGRGFLLSKFSEFSKSNYDLVGIGKCESPKQLKNSSDLPRWNEENTVLKAHEYNDLPRWNEENTVIKAHEYNDLLKEEKSANPQNNFDFVDGKSSSEITDRCNNDLLKEGEFEKSSDINNLTRESNSEALSKSKDKTPIVNDNVQDSSDHEDRYFDIEEPTYLNCSKEFSFLEKKVQTTNQNVDKSEDEQYMKLLTSNKGDEHEPIDDKAFVNRPAEVKLDSELLEQQILRDYSIGQIPERMKMSCGLIHGNVIANPVSKLSDLKLEQHVFSNLNAKNMRELSRSQMFAIPVLLQRRNLVLVGPPNSGKTLAFVMSLLSLLHDNEYYSSLKPGNGPRCIFVSSCAQNVNYISQFCSAICGAKLTIITTHGGGLELERKEDLTNGCEILVTTPRCLLRLLKHTSVTNLFRVCHIVFDDVDTLLSIFCSEIQEIMNNLNKMLQIRKRYSNIGIQVVLVGEKWTPVLEEITFKALDTPVLCITAHLEAALYARIKPKTYILSPDSKIKKLQELLDFTSNKIRTVVVCRSADEVKSLRPLLELTLSNVLVAHEEMSLNQLVEVGELWIRCTSPPILLCSDPTLHELAVTNALWLIHYSMPDNKSSFSERFSTIKEHLYDRIKYPKTAPPECQVHILVDDTNELQFPEIISFMKRLNTSIPDVFLEAVKKISVLKEERKIDMPFCENLLMFGHCWRRDKCKRQHIFNKSRDTPEKLPINGIMKVKLLYAHNPSYYSVRVLAIKNSDNDEQWIEFPSNYALIAFKMSNYFSFRENRFAHGRVKIADLVAIEVEPDLMFKRAKVIDIITRDEKYNPEEVMVHFIDEGSVDKVTAAQLLHLPPELQIYSQEAYDMYLLGLQPVDYDKAWSFASTLKIQKSISNLNFQEGDNKFFIANIALVAGKSLLASSFLCYEWLDLNKCHVVLFSPKKFILDTGLAEPNPKHFSSLMNLALDAGLISSIPEEFKKNDVDEDGEKVQWAHLDKENTNVVHVISSDSPSLFFLKLYKFSDRLELLEKELTAILETKVTKLEMLERDMICAAKNPNENRWNRGMINYVNKDEVEVFFVDYGDCLLLPLSDISRLPKGFISRLPFQAIECSLVGILPLDDDWLPQAIEVFDSMCFNDDHKLKSMFAKVCDVTSAGITTGHHFKVILSPSTEGKDVYINKEMVYRGFANWDIQTKHYLTESIVWSEDGGGVEEWEEDEWEAQESAEKEEKQNENINSDIHSLETKDNGTTDTPSTTSKDNFTDIMSIIANGDFEVGNANFLINLLPNELQQRLKEKSIDQALDQLNREKELKNSKILIEISNKVEEEVQETNAVDEGPLLESCGVYHPEVYWSQRDLYVRIKINLPDINKFQLDYSDQTLMFRALANDKYYWFEIVLFGQICKENVTYVSKGLYFEIKLEKFIEGEFWPRLLYEDFKFPWIKLDPDFIEQDDLSLIESMFKKGMKFRQVETLGSPEPPSSSGVPEPDSDLESISSKSDNEEFTDLMHDSIDPDSD